MEQSATPQQTLNKGSIEYFTIYKVAHPASVTAFLGLAHAYVTRRSEHASDFSHRWFAFTSDSTILTVRGSRNALSLLSEYIASHTQYLSGVEVVYHGRGLKRFESIVDDLYARRLSLREGASRT